MTIDSHALYDMLFKLLELNNSILSIFVNDINFNCENEVNLDERSKIDQEAEEVIRDLKHEIEFRTCLKDD